MLYRIAVVFLAAAALTHSQTPASADALLDQAKAQAAPDHRVVWVIFTASW